MVLKGDTNIKYLKTIKFPFGMNGRMKTEIWVCLWISMESWPTRGGQTIDQIKEIIRQIKETPDSRRIIVSAWNVGEVKMWRSTLSCVFSLYFGNKLSCQLYQRSADTFLGVLFNIASYALLTMMVAQVCKLELGDFVHTLGDAHLYLNHLEQAQLQISRTPRELPTMKINPAVTEILDFKYEDFELLNYDPHPHIKGAVAV